MSAQRDQSDTLVVAGGWWPPGKGEPGKDWDYEQADLVLHFDGGDSIDVCLVVGEEERALCSVPLEGLALAFTEMLRSRCESKRHHQ